MSMVPSGTTAWVAELQISTSSALCGTSPRRRSSTARLPSVDTLPFSVNFTLLATGSVEALCAASAVK